MKRESKFSKKIGFKITLWYSLSVMVILGVTGTFLYYSLQHKLRNQFHLILLDESIEILQPFLNGNLDLKALNSIIEKESASQLHYQMSIRLLDSKQNIVVSSTSFLDHFLMASENAYINAINGKETFEMVHVENKSNPYLLLTKPVVRNGSEKYVLQISMYMRDVYKPSKYFKENIIMLIPGLLIITIFGGWLIAKKSLAPIDRINKEAQKITALSLNTRLKPSYTGDELDELINTINLMLNRLDNSFQKLVQFTSDVSHELRTPIATLKAGIEVALAEKMTVEEYNQLLERFLCQFERISRLIENLMVLLRSDAGSKVLNTRTFSLSTTLKELCNTFSLVAEAKNVQIKINEMADVRINGDEILLQRVFSNFLDNAIKYTPPDGNVYVSLKNNSDNVLVIIRDTGIGIPEDQHEKIFDRFFRVDPSRSRNTGGAGLGLSISKNIVELHNGKIAVESKLGVGSTFIVTIPKNGMD